VSVDIALTENREASILRIFSYPFWRVETTEAALVCWTMYDAKSILGFAFSSCVVLGSTQCVEVDVEASAIEVIQYVLETGVKEINLVGSVLD
jgi:hypothetical protein